MNRAKRIDGNQTKVVNLLKQMPGVSVAVTSHIGQGFPDICVGFRKANFFFELKDPAQPPSKRKLTPAEDEFMKGWYGQYHVVESFDQILEVLNYKTR